MIVSSYANFFSLSIFGLFLLPAVALGLLGQKAEKIGLKSAMKWYGVIISIPMMALIFGATSKQMIQFSIFILYEIFLVYAYYHFKKRANSELVYYSVFSLSMAPIIIVKAFPLIAGKVFPLVYRVLEGKKVDIPVENFNFLGFIGISYISFKIWQLIIEIHDNNIKSLPFFEMIYFIIFFPTITSGPIDRYQRFKKDLDAKIETKDYIINYFFFGIKKIFMGMLYKFGVATFINIFVMEKLPPHATSLGTTLIYMYAYTFYLFFDFAGYSNFAIGTSYILGIKTPENFNKPFLAHNMKEFWDRWHMSLSKWFGDYLFSRFVLGTLRNGTFKSKKVATRCGYMLTMVTMGLWHGLSLFYVAYGVYQGLMLVFTDVYVKSKVYRRFKKSKYYDIVSRFVCFQVVSFGMLIFSGYLFNF